MTAKACCLAAQRLCVTSLCTNLLEQLLISLHMALVISPKSLTELSACFWLVTSTCRRRVSTAACSSYHRLSYPALHSIACALSNCKWDLQVDEDIQATEGEVPQDDQGVQQQSGSATPLSEEEAGASSKQEGEGLPSGQGMEKNYTDTIESLLSELWKERLVRLCAHIC